MQEICLTVLTFIHDYKTKTLSKLGIEENFSTSWRMPTIKPTANIVFNGETLQLMSYLLVKAEYPT